MSFEFKFLSFGNCYSFEKANNKLVKCRLASRGKNFEDLKNIASSLPVGMPCRSDLLELFDECNADECFANPKRFNSALKILFVLLDMVGQQKLFIDEELSRLENSYEVTLNSYKTTIEAERTEMDKKLEEIKKRFELEKNEMADTNEKELAMLNGNFAKVLQNIENEISDSKMEEYNVLKERCETLEKLVIALKQYHKQHLVSDTLFADLHRLEKQIQGFDQALGLSDSGETEKVVLEEKNPNQ